MRTVGAGEARRSLSRLLDEVEQGQTVTITRYGRPVARLERVRSHRSIAETIRSWEAYRDAETISLGGLSIREMIDEGRM